MTYNVFSGTLNPAQSIYCSNVAHRRPTKPCTMFGHLLDCCIIYTFSGLLPLTEFCQVQTSLCIQVLRSPILAALLHGTRPVGVSQTLQCGTWNGITELSHAPPPIFGWAAITLGIGPHSSVFWFSVLKVCVQPCILKIKLLCIRPSAVTTYTWLYGDWGLCTEFRHWQGI